MKNCGFSPRSFVLIVISEGRTAALSRLLYMDWILDSLIQAALSKITAALNFLTILFLENFGIDFATINNDGEAVGIFDKYFPLAHGLQTLFMATAIGIIFSVFIFQLVKNFFGPLSDAEDPLHLIGRLAISGLFTWFSYDILAYIQIPIDKIYNMFVQIDTVTKFQFPAFNMNYITEGVNADLIVVLLIQLFFTIAIGWNYIMLLLEIVERYIILGVLFYTSPWAFSTLASANTKSIFQSWMKMLGSQYLLMFLNVFFLKIFVNGLQNAPLAYQDTWEFFIWNLCMLGILKVGQRVDHHMASLGLSTAQAGTGIASTLAAVGFSMSYMSRGLSRSAGSIAKDAGLPGGGRAMSASEMQYKSPGGGLTDVSAKSVMNQNMSNPGATVLTGRSAAQTAMDYFGIKPTGAENMSKCTFGAGKAHLEYMDGTAIDIMAADGKNAHKPMPGIIAAETKGADGFQYYMSGRGNPSVLAKNFGGSSVESHLSKICSEENSPFSFDRIKQDGIDTGAYMLYDNANNQVFQYSPSAMYDTSDINTKTENFGGFEWNVSNVTPTAFEGNVPVDFNDNMHNAKIFESYFPGASESFGGIENAWYNQDAMNWSVYTNQGIYNVYDSVSYTPTEGSVHLSSNNAAGFFAVGSELTPERRQDGVIGRRNMQMDEASTMWQKTKFTGTDDIYKYTKGRKK